MTLQAGELMGEQPDILSSELSQEERGHAWRRARNSRAVLVACGVLLACLAAAIAYTALLVAHRDHTIAALRADLRAAHPPAPSAAAGPVYSGSAIVTFPDGAGGSFSMVTVAIRPHPGTAPLTWLFVYGQHGSPGEHYGLLGGSCGNGNTISYDWADGTADRNGDLTIVADNLSISPRDPHVWVLVHRLGDGGTLGGIRGPFIGGGSKAFRSAPPC